MTPLEIILLVIIWVFYGIFAAYKTNGNMWSDGPDAQSIGVLMVLISPLILVYRMIAGIFKEYEVD